MERGIRGLMSRNKDISLINQFMQILSEVSEGCTMFVVKPAAIRFLNWNFKHNVKQMPFIDFNTLLVILGVLLA